MTATAINYSYGISMIEEAKRLGLELKAVNPYWELYNGESLLLKVLETGAVQKLLEGYKEGLMERVESIGPTLDYRNGQWVIERDGEAIFCMEPNMRYIDVFIEAYGSAREHERAKKDCLYVGSK